MAGSVKQVCIIGSVFVEHLLNPAGKLIQTQIGGAAANVCISLSHLLGKQVKITLIAMLGTDFLGQSVRKVFEELGNVDLSLVQDVPHQNYSEATIGESKNAEYKFYRNSQQQ